MYLPVWEGKVGLYLCKDHSYLQPCFELPSALSCLPKRSLEQVWQKQRSSRSRDRQQSLLDFLHMRWILRPWKYLVWSLLQTILIRASLDCSSKLLWGCQVALARSHSAFLLCRTPHYTNMSAIFYSDILMPQLLGECRTLWGEPERGRWCCCMHASIWRLCCARIVE